MRRHHIQHRHGEAAALLGRGEGYSSPDVIEKFFLNSHQPTVALFTISICLVGVMDFLPKRVHHLNTWSEELHSVSGFYGPGVVIAWCLMSMSMLYDANQVFKTKSNGFHYFKYATILFWGVWALGDAIWRALHTDFGPSYAAALYMSDKGFELGTLLYTLYLFPVHRRLPRQTTRQAPPNPSDEERADHGPNSHSFHAQAAAAIAEYKIYPCIAMFGIWVWCRALSNGHLVYNIHAQNPDGVTIRWKPLLAWYWKPIVVIQCFVLTSLVDYLTKWGWWSWSLPVGILSSFAAMHSGLFGTYTPLKLTSIKITETDQISAIISTVLFLIIQYGRTIPVVKKGVQKLKFWVKDEHDANLLDPNTHGQTSSGQSDFPGSGHC